MRKSSALAVVCGLASLGVSAMAQAQTKADENYSYYFDNDDLTAEAMATTPPLLRVRHKGVKVMLIRERVSFAAELLQSVERL